MPIDISKVRVGDMVRVAYTYELPPTYVGDSVKDVYRCSRIGYVVERQWLGEVYVVLRIHDQVNVLILARSLTDSCTISVGCSAIAEVLPAYGTAGLHRMQGIPVRWAGAGEMLTTYPGEFTEPVRCDCGGDAVRLPHRDWCSVERAVREGELQISHYWRGV